jgi:hypothetical protein
MYRTASDMAPSLDLGAPQGVALLSMMMFAAGHGVIDDPIYAEGNRTALEAPTTETRIGNLWQRMAGLVQTIVEDNSAEPGS